MSDEIVAFNPLHVETGLEGDNVRLEHVPSTESASLSRNRILGRSKKSSEIQTSNYTGDTYFDISYLYNILLKFFICFFVVTLNF